jgi:hypothetical protein
MHLTNFTIKAFCKPYLNSKYELLIYRQLNIIDSCNKHKGEPSANYKSKCKDKCKNKCKNKFKDCTLYEIMSKEENVRKENIKKFELYLNLGLRNIKGVFDLNYLPYDCTYDSEFLKDESNMPLLSQIFVDSSLLRIKNVKKQKTVYSDYECTVCFESSDNFTNCGHNICFGCIEKSSKVICPLCKQKIITISGKIQRTSKCLLNKESVRYIETILSPIPFPVLRLTDIVLERTYTPRSELYPWRVQYPV